MLDFVMGIGFAFVIEGVFWSFFPHQIMKIMRTVTPEQEHTLRYMGVGSLALGVAIIWYVQQSRMIG